MWRHIAHDSPSSKGNALVLCNVIPRSLVGIVYSTAFAACPSTEFFFQRTARGSTISARGLDETLGRIEFARVIRSCFGRHDTANVVHSFATAVG